MWIGIAGGSGSGKSTFAKQLAEGLPLPSSIISTDSFFKRPLPKMISPSSGKEYEDWNSPESLDIPRLLEAVKQRRMEEAGNAVTLVEGLSALYFPELRELFDLSIFIELDSDERMYRRIKRNMQMWGVSLQEVADYYLESAKYGEERYFLPTKRYADLVISGAAGFEKPISVVSAWVCSGLQK